MLGALAFGSTAVLAPGGSAQILTTNVVGTYSYFAMSFAGLPTTVDVASNGGQPLPFTPNLASVVVIIGPSFGTLIRTASGFTYIPRAGIVANDSMQYRICGSPTDAGVPCAIVNVGFQSLTIPHLPVLVTPPPHQAVVQQASPAVALSTPAPVIWYPYPYPAPVTPVVVQTSPPPAPATSSGSSLAFTGSNVGRLTLFAAAALLEGLFLLMISPRRREVVYLRR